VKDVSIEVTVAPTPADSLTVIETLAVHRDAVCTHVAVHDWGAEMLSTAVVGGAGGAGVGAEGPLPPHAYVTRSKRITKYLMSTSL
jgi:hypothetical protein